MNDPDHISDSLETIFCVKILKFFYAYQGWKNSDTGSGIEKFGYWIRNGKNSDARSGIRDKHPGSATLCRTFPQTPCCVPGFRWTRTPGWTVCWRSPASTCRVASSGAGQQRMSSACVATYRREISSLLRWGEGLGGWGGIGICKIVNCKAANVFILYSLFQGCGSAFISSGSSILGWIPIRIQYGSRALMTKNWKKITA